MIKVDILGPSRFWYGGAELALTPLQRHVHIALRLAGGTLTMSELAGQVGPAATVASLTTLRGCLSRPRKQVVDAGGSAEELSRTIRVSGGRTLVSSIAQWDIDAEHFRTSASAAREAYDDRRFHDASRLIAEAVSLWRGEPLPDAGDRPFAIRFKEDLASWYLALRLTWIKTGVTLGGHREAVPDLRRLLLEMPEQGEIPMLLAIALYRSDLTAEASRICQDAITSRKGDGIESRRLQDLQHAILSDTFPYRGPLGW